MSQYVNLKTDWAFKKLMGQEPQMRSFLNSLLSEEYGEIKSLTFENVEVQPDRNGGRGVIFDLLCTTENNDNCRDAKLFAIVFQNARKLLPLRADEQGDKPRRRVEPYA